MASDSLPPAAPTPARPALVAGRECGNCAMCCHLVEIAVLDKKAGDWCIHCPSHERCDIYEARPQPCRDFYCLYRLNPTLSEEWYPPRAHMMLKVQEGPMVLAMVEPAYPDIWREEPYFARFKRWSVQFDVIIVIGQRKIAVFPDHEVDLGEIAPDAQLEFISVDTPQGVRKSVRLKRPD